MKGIMSFIEYFNNFFHVNIILFNCIFRERPTLEDSYQ